ncbi:MAG: hypothetical protein H6822_04345 [Planctomycetaceae bacterium]|nr:hypothetical protein [Planctomycetales bacterium]MCB9921384.1 hypothetical protein [Planctomycetaceae bacterium]
MPLQYPGVLILEGLGTDPQAGRDNLEAFSRNKFLGEIKSSYPYSVAVGRAKKRASRNREALG